MDLYILDSLLRPRYVVDKFESLIWTERWQEYGDFELHLTSTLENRINLSTGTKLGKPDSHRVMTVESVEDSTDEDGREMLEIKGKSLEAVLEDRVARHTLDSLDAAPVWSITANGPVEVCEKMFDDICRPPGLLDTADEIPFITAGTIFPPFDIPEPSFGALSVWKQKLATLYDAINKICVSYDLGFYLVRALDASELYFDVYTGNDRTTEQTANIPVIFASNFESLQNTKEFSSIQKSKNVAYVFADEGYRTVYGENVDPNVEGFERRVLIVNPSLQGETSINDALDRYGKEALAEHRGVSIFDGEINKAGGYEYGVDYGLGDLVEMRNRDNIISQARIVENIFVDDQNGERSYPTLRSSLFTGINDWLAWSNDPTEWMDYDGDSFTWSEFD